VATLSVWKFQDPAGAEAALSKLQSLQKQELVQVVDAATVSWPEGRKKPKTEQLHSTQRAGALGGAFWGMLFGLLFLIPLLGAAMGAAAGALAGHFTDVGIDDDFIKSVREKVTPGTSALFVMTDNAVVDRLKPEFADTRAELIATNLSAEQEAKLREIFGEEE
jgi:uncharacterized membrane protein